MKLYKALSFCNEVEKVATKKKRLTLLDAYVVCENFNRRFNIKSYKNQKKLDKKKQLIQAKKWIVIGKKGHEVKEYVPTYKAQQMKSVPPIDDGMTSYDEWRSIFQDKKFQDTPIGKVYIDVDELDLHFSEKTENETYWRKTKAGYVLDTLKNPQEIWVNDGGYIKNKNDDENAIAMQKRAKRQKRDLSYVFIKQYTIIDKGVKRSMVQVVVVTPDNNGVLFVKSHYSEKEKIADIYVRRHGALIYP